MMHGNSARARRILLVGVLLGGDACHSRPRAAPTTPQSETADADSAATTAGGSSSATGSSSAIDRDEIRSRHPVRVDELLAGQPGVQVSHTPEGGISVRIRGSGTINGSGEPLFIIDGMVVGIGDNGILRGLAPTDVIRVEVLRDAGSTSIYGSRGANGVVLITTRRLR